VRPDNLARYRRAAWWIFLPRHVLKLLKRHGVRVEDMGETYLAEPDVDGDESRTLRPLKAAAITYRPRAGQKGLMLQGAMPRGRA